MVFCGQCGFLLPPDAKKCPRCGVATPYNQAAGEAAPDQSSAPTIFSHVPLSQNNSYVTSPYTNTPDPQNSQNPTVLSSQPINTVPETPDAPLHDPDFLALDPRVDISTPTEMAPAHLYPQAGAHQGNYFPQQPVSYPGLPTPPDHFATRNKRGFRKLLTGVAFLVGLLLIAMTVWLVVVGPPQLPVGETDLTPTSVPTPTSPQTPTEPPLIDEEQARSVIENYYNHINNKEYQQAYDLWASNPQSYDAFAQGFAYTLHDEITFGTIERQEDGTVIVNVTIVATEDTSSGSGTQQQTFQGYYIVGQQSDTSWKIVDAYIEKV